jgi:hypothetical protein
MIRFTFRRVTDPRERLRLSRGTLRLGRAGGFISAVAWTVTAFLEAQRGDVGAAGWHGLLAVTWLGIALVAWWRLRALRQNDLR